MRKLLPFLFLLFITVTHAQDIKLRLSSGLDSLKFHVTTLQEAEKMLGKPNNTRKKDGYNTDITYTKLGIELSFSKRLHNKLWGITIEENSPVVINDSIKVNSSDTLSLVKVLGFPTEKHRNDLFIEYSYHSNIASSVYFYFNKQGILTSALMSEPIVISVDF
ncbi:MAG TPA: hypothetical protein VK890_02805 [Bacteroidia bacterium]|jgi:hypothetical protein|nr:hypothetical protein [Bacteroidia bacterium]